jgi:glycosyltransferase involved in cell wall biosynthesis
VTDADELLRVLQENAGRLDHISAQVSGIERLLRSTQALATRAYERSFRWDEELAELRGTPAYEAAYEPEPFVTVRVATYNRGELLTERALASLLRQTYTNWECIVVGDACTDDTAERVAALGDDRIRFENLPFRGPYPEDQHSFWMVAGTYPVHRSFALASGAWTAQLDDDDEWDDDHLEALLAEAQRTHAEVVYAKWRVRDVENGRLLGAELGAWPPRHSFITFQSAIEHGVLRRFPPDINAYLAEEPGDWHRIRRLWDAGVRFGFLDRALTTVWYRPATEDAQRTWAAAKESVGYADEPG